LKTWIGFLKQINVKFCDAVSPLSLRVGVLPYSKIKHITNAQKKMTNCQIQVDEINHGPND
jgi:hypothetical protein